MLTADTCNQDLDYSKGKIGDWTSSNTTLTLLKGYFILTAVIMVCKTMCDYDVQVDMTQVHSLIEKLKLSVNMAVPHIKLCLAPITWFSAGFGAGYLSKLNTKKNEFNVVEYSKNCPSRRVKRMFDKLKLKKIENNKISARSCNLQKSYPMRLWNQNLFKVRSDAIIQDRWNKYNDCLKKYSYCDKHKHVNHYHTENQSSHSWRQTCFKCKHKGRTLSTHNKNQHVGADGKPLDVKKSYRYIPLKRGNYDSKKNKKAWNETIHKLTKEERSKTSEEEWVPVPFKSSDVYFTSDKSHQVIINENCNSFEIIWDSGASVCISPNKSDFIDYTTNVDLKTVKTIGGATSVIKGQGTVLWSVHDERGMLRHLKLKAYHIPSSTTRLLSTSSLLNTYKGETITIDAKILTLSGLERDGSRTKVTVYNHPNTRLPTTVAYRYNDVVELNPALINIVSTVDSENHNLFESEKELLHLHYCLGHLSFKKIKHLMQTGVLFNTGNECSLPTAANKIVHLPKYAACLLRKQELCSNKAKTTTIVKDRAGVLKESNILHGAEVSVDHFISSVKGRLFSGYNKRSDDSRYVGGCIFVDHSSSYVHIEFQSSLSSHDIQCAKAVSHTYFLWYHMPDPSTGLSAQDLFLTRCSQRKFYDLQVWGCPTYVLSKAIQEGKKIPCWQPISDRHVYIGISPQFHVAFDEWFATIGASKNGIPDLTSDERLKMFGSSTYQYTFDDEDTEEQEDHITTRKILEKQKEIGLTINNPQQESRSIIPTVFKKEEAGMTTDSHKSTGNDTNVKTSAPSPLLATPTPLAPVATSEEAPGVEILWEQPGFDLTNPGPTSGAALSPERKKLSSQRKPILSPDTSPRAKRRIKALSQLMYTDDKQSFTHLATVATQSAQHAHIFYCSKLLEGVEDSTFIFTTQSQTNPDIFDLDQAMMSKHKDSFIKAVEVEVRALEDFVCWKEIPIEMATTKVLPGTWVFQINKH